MCLDGLKLIPVQRSECPKSAILNSLRTCDQVLAGELCEADGECGTDWYLNNCGYYQTKDVYRKENLPPSRLHRIEVRVQENGPIDGGIVIRGLDFVWSEGVRTSLDSSLSAIRRKFGESSYVLNAIRQGGDYEFGSSEYLTKIKYWNLPTTHGAQLAGIMFETNLGASVVYGRQGPTLEEQVVTAPYGQMIVDVISSCPVCWFGTIHDVVTRDAWEACPVSHPFAYWTNNAYCCAYDEECVYWGQAEASDGSSLHANGTHSMCCKDHAFVECSSPPCRNYPGIVATSTPPLTTGPGTSTTSTSTTSEGLESLVGLENDTECIDLANSYDDCDARIRDSFPSDFCSISSQRRDCLKSCCRNEIEMPSNSSLEAGNCSILEDVWPDCDVRIQDRYKDCQDYCSIALERRGCQKTCCLQDTTPQASPSVDLPLTRARTCGMSNLTDYWQDCSLRISDRRKNGQEYCAIEFQRRGCEKSCCDPAENSSQLDGNCVGLDDLWHDCSERIEGRERAGLDYCAETASQCGCQKSCCIKTHGQAAGEPVLDCSRTDLADSYQDCQTRITDREEDGLDYCSSSIARSCEKSCCETTQSSGEALCGYGLWDFWPDCEARIRDRSKDGQDYCATAFEQAGCQKSCCRTTVTTTTPSSCMTLTDDATDCISRIGDRFQDGTDYCASEDDRLNCEMSCCLGVGLPVQFTITMQGLNCTVLGENTSMQQGVTQAISNLIAEETGVSRENVSINSTCSLNASSDARRLQFMEDVLESATTFQITILPQQISPQQVAAGITPQLGSAVATEIMLVEGINETIVVSDVTTPQVLRSILRDQEYQLNRTEQLSFSSRVQSDLLIMAVGTATAML